MAQSVGISWLWRLKSDATGSIPAGWVRGVTWVLIFLYSSILTSLRKENHLDNYLILNFILCGIEPEGTPSFHLLYTWGGGGGEVFLMTVRSQ